MRVKQASLIEIGLKGHNAIGKKSPFSLSSSSNSECDHNIWDKPDACPQKMVGIPTEKTHFYTGQVTSMTARIKRGRSFLERNSKLKNSLFYPIEEHSGGNGPAHLLTWDLRAVYEQHRTHSALLPWSPRQAPGCAGLTFPSLKAGMVFSGHTRWTDDTRFFSHSLGRYNVADKK